MTRDQRPQNRIRELRNQRGWTQAELANRAGISRTAVTAIESERLVPSVAAALSLAQALHSSVEELFGSESKSSCETVWAWQPADTASAAHTAEIDGRIIQYPASSAPMWTPLPDWASNRNDSRLSTQANDTLVMASCDPAAGMLASLYTAVTGLRMLVFERSSRIAAEMLRDGLVHLAGLHLSTADAPNRNMEVLQQLIESGFQTIRIARWQEGVVLAPTSSFRSVRSVVQSRVTWVAREPGSGARQCLDQLLEGRVSLRKMTRHHQGVAEAVASGWADAGVCVQLVGQQAGLRFLPVQQEAYDVCIPNAYANDRRVKAFLSVIRSKAYRRLLGDLPGYNISETGDILNSSN